MTWTIQIKGQVQGVGFRPYVWRAARARNLNGWVANGLEGVCIKINATAEQAFDFHQCILQNIPSTACVTDASIAPDAVEMVFDDFSIRESRGTGLPVLHLTPDVAICEACRRDIHDPANRRYRYAFTTCTVCGPRYSILTALPYDRPATTMHHFQMCGSCQAEYDDPADRRYYAQTNSCPTCGIMLQLHSSGTADHQAIDQNQIIRQVVGYWQTGAIVAVKGIGGYILTCDAANATTVAALRTRKHRPTKPFALMYPSLAVLAGDAILKEAEILQMESPAAPIVLLDIQPDPLSGLDRAGIAPGLHKIGAMLPNAPLFELLLSDFGKPIVATSANITNAPLLYEDNQALRDLSSIADYILTHNRPIAMPQDDSVVTFRHSDPVIIRRARGLAPAFIQPGLRVPDATVLALGADLKSTFTLAHLGNINISQYLGDLSEFESQERFHLVLQHLTGLFDARPARIVCDGHPGYYTTQLGKELADRWQVPLTRVQHHEAHFAAVLAENNLPGSGEPVLGVVWDGTGMGHDGQIWGSEFFVYQDTAVVPFNRVAHFSYFPVLLGDKMAREPRLSALSVCARLAEAAQWLQPKFSAVEWDLYQKLPGRDHQIQTSSAGRLFDAAAALLGLADKVSYEGEAAMLLENLAGAYCRQYGFDFENAYYPTLRQGASLILDTETLFRQILTDMQAGAEKGYIAAKFHYSLVAVIRQIAIHTAVKKIAFSGGVFQNMLLLDMIEHHLSPDYQLFFHRQLASNDENISFGQWAHTVITDTFSSSNN